MVRTRSALANVDVIYAFDSIPAHAEVDYLIRAVDAESVRELRARADRIAQGAAMMTDTKVTIRAHKGCSNLITIPSKA